MLKIAFLADLKERLYGMPQEEIEERLSFYNEMINDRMEEGLSEEDAVAAIGSVDEIAAQIMSTIPEEPLPEPVPMPDYAAFQPLDYPVEDVKPEKSLNGLKTAFLLLGFPIWGSLLIAAFAIVFALIVSLFAVVISFWAVAISRRLLRLPAFRALSDPLSSAECRSESRGSAAAWCAQAWQSFCFCAGAQSRGG